MLVAITGTSKSGKTETALSLAKALAKENNLVLVLNANLTFEIIAKRLGENVSEEKDFTNYLCKNDDDKLAKDFTIKTKQDNLYIMSLANKDITFSNLGFTNEKASKLFLELDSMYDYVIADTASFTDLFSSYSISKADIILNLNTMNLKSLIESKAYIKLISLAKRRTAKVFNICSKHQEALALPEYETIANIKFDFDVPYLAGALELEHQEKIYYSSDFIKKDMKKYKAAIDKIASAVRKD